MGVIEPCYIFWTICSPNLESLNGTPIVSDKKKYIKDNYIPNESFKFDKFEEFFTARKEILKEKMKKILI